MEITMEFITWCCDVVILVAILAFAIAVLKYVYETGMKELENEIVDCCNSCFMEGYEFGRDLGRARHLK